jgi:hypothetical protein
MRPIHSTSAPTFETLAIQNAAAQLQGAIPRFAC